MDVDRFGALLTATGHLIWNMGADGQAVDEVPYWRSFTGQSAAAVQGAGWLDAVHPDDRERAARTWGRAVADGTPYETEYRLRRADGAYRLFLDRATPVRDAAGQIQEWVGVCIDLTDRYHSEAALYAMVQTALDAIITINHAGRIIAFNPAAEQIFGYRRGAVLGQDMAELLIPPDLPPQHRPRLP